MKFKELLNQFQIHDKVIRNFAPKGVIYFLVENDDTIVYVGKSDESNVFGRLAAHKSDKDFNDFSILKTNLAEQELLRLERGLISLIRPRYNQQLTGLDIDSIEFAISFLKSLGVNRVEVKKTVLPMDAETLNIKPGDLSFGVKDGYFWHIEKGETKVRELQWLKDNLRANRSKMYKALEQGNDDSACKYRERVALYKKGIELLEINFSTSVTEKH